MSSRPTLAATPPRRPQTQLEQRTPTRSSAPLEAIEWRLAVRAGVALGVANARYWSAVAPSVRAQLRRWRLRARDIADPTLRTLALHKLGEEGFNAEVAATLATLAPRRHRRAAVEAIVALEILFDFLDGLTESPSRESPDAGHRLFKAFTDAVAPGIAPAGDYYRYHSTGGDDGYLDELVGAVRAALASLPAAAKLADIMRRSAERSAEAQLQIHACSLPQIGQLERWARRRAADTQLNWREYLAGAASSVLAVHALIAAAADHRTTHAQGLEIDRIYLPIAVLPTILDSLIDHERDAMAGRPGYVQYYGDKRMLTRALAEVIQEAVRRARTVRNGPHHVMTIVGVVAYYTSAPTARSDFARPVTMHVRRQLRPLIAPTLTLMRAWRTVKRARPRRRERDSSLAIGQGT